MTKEKLFSRKGLTFSVINGRIKGLKNGIYKDYYKNGSLSSIKSYKKGLLEGNSTYFNGFGRAFIRRVYKAGQLKKISVLDKLGSPFYVEEILKSGAKRCLMYSNGDIVCHGLFVNNKREGIWVENQSDSSVRFSTYHNGVLNGPFRVTKFGHTLESGNYKNGELEGLSITQSYHGNAKVVTTYRKGVPVDEEFYDSNGKLVGKVKPKAQNK